MAITLVTGGSGGIGREIALYFARKKHDVIVQYNKGKERAENLISEIQCKFGVRAIAIQADFSIETDIQKMYQVLAESFGLPEIVINNAGIAEQSLFTDITPEKWRQMLDVNLSAAFHICRYAAPEMIRRKKGAIVNISSIWGLSGASCEVAYSAAKAGIIGLTQAMAKELGPSGIRVNCVAPGVINTEMNANHSPETMAALAEETPLCRIGKPEEVAAAVYFLASDEASFITGQTLCVDGGFLR